LPSHDTISLLSFLILRNFPTTHSMAQLCYPFCYLFLSTLSFPSLPTQSLTISKVLFLLIFLSFHCLQFLSNLPQYSWLYLLFDHLNNFLAINLLGNSLLLNIPSSYSYCAIFFISYWYFLSNFSIASFVFFKFSFPF